MALLCASPACTRSVPRSARSGLCGGCDAHWRRWTVPTGGFISSFDLQRIANEFLRDVSPTHSEITAALRIMRGTRHRAGPWEDRPAFRLQPLLHGRIRQRIPQLLVGRRKAPSMRSLGMALCHYHLANTVIGTRGPYSQFLAGASFYVRKSPIAPKDTEVLTGGATNAGYRLHISDYSAIGREVLKAGKVLGVDPRSRWVSDRVASIYLEGLNTGRYRPVIIVPHGCFRTTAPGDSALDHRLPSSPTIPRQYHQAIRRASGRIDKAWPEGLDDLFSQTPEERRLTSPPRHQHHQRIPTCPAPDTDWIFNT